MVTIVGCKATYARAGAAFRRRTKGPEHDLVNCFLERAPFAIPKGHRLTVFREPRLESGFPDLVAVIWKGSIAAVWNRERGNVTSLDMRLIQYLLYQGPCYEAHLEAVFSKSYMRSLDRLEAAEMVRFTKKKWTCRPLNRLFAVRNIIAVEAKIDDWRTALKQAALNTWFASASYVLLPRIPRGDSVIRAARMLGLGVWACGDSLVERRPTSPESLPRSYASWLFNEWAWRQSELNGAVVDGY